jgi:ATPase subunit of ABC transporter with duplicated ATPase domains
MSRDDNTQLGGRGEPFPALSLPGLLLLQIMLRAYPDLKEQEARSHLGSFGVSGPLALQPLYTLSGGQKSRVALAKVSSVPLGARGGGPAAP